MENPSLLHHKTYYWYQTLYQLFPIIKFINSGHTWIFHKVFLRFYSVIMNRTQ